MAQSFFRSAVRDDCKTEIEVEIAVHRWGDFPTWEDGPGDGPEVEIIDAWLLADADCADAPRLALTDAERDRIEAEFCENPPEPDYGDDF